MNTELFNRPALVSEYHTFYMNVNNTHHVNKHETKNNYLQQQSHVAGMTSSSVRTNAANCAKHELRT